MRATIGVALNLLLSEAGSSSLEALYRAEKTNLVKAESATR